MTIEDTDGSSPPSETSLDKAKFDLEKWKAEEEIKLRRGELEIKRKEASKSFWSSPLLLGITGLFATILASIVQNAYQTYANKSLEDQKFHSNLSLERQNSLSTQELERQKFESDLIPQALGTDNQEIAGRRLKRLLDLGVVRDPDRTIEYWVSNPSSIPLDNPSENFVGHDRADAKLSIGSGKVENFNELADLIASLPSREVMLSHMPPITTDAKSARVIEEQRNVHLHTFLYAASREADNDFHLIVGRDPKVGREMYMTAEVSGLPPKNSSAFAALNAARTAFNKFFESKKPGAGYDFYSSTPIPVEIEGSLFFDATFLTGQAPGPPSLKSRMPTIWEIHPVTSIKLGQLG